MYSIGKDSTVLLHLALKAFLCRRSPFPMPRMLQRDPEVP